MQKYFTDQMHNRIAISFPPKRIISLVPSQTELLYHLGLSDQVIAQTLFCIHPDWAHQIKTRIGGTKKLNIEKIRELKPDLIIGNKEENEQSQIEELAKEFPVWMSDIKNLEEAMDMIGKIGELVDRKSESEVLQSNIKTQFNLLINKEDSPKRAAYFIWREPWMAAGKDTFITDMMKRCGLINVFEVEDSRYPEITHLQLQASHVELILLSSEPYPFKEKHIEEIQHYCPHAKILLVDGEMFSWYGSRLLLAPSYFNKLLNGN